MKEKTFEEEFPSWNEFMVDINLRKLQVTKSELEYYKLRCEYQLQAMEKHCLDKKRVQGAIDKDIKWFKDRLDVQMVFKKETKSSDVAYAVVKDKEELKKADMGAAIYLVKDRSVILNYLEGRLKKELGLE